MATSLPLAAVVAPGVAVGMGVEVDGGGGVVTRAGAAGLAVAWVGAAAP